MVAGASWLCHSCSSDDSVEDRNHEQHCKQVISGEKDLISLYFKTGKSSRKLS
jgi:hypothetical protein